MAPTQHTDTPHTYIKRGLRRLATGAAPTRTEMAMRGEEEEGVSAKDVPKRSRCDTRQKGREGGIH